MYNKTYEERMKDNVLLALSQYAEGDNPSAGYNILRYAAKGLIKVDPSADASIFIEYYPRHVGYAILNLGRQGKLQYKEPD